MTLESFEQEDVQFLLEQGLWGGPLGSPRLMLCFHGWGYIQMFPTCGIFSSGGRGLAVKTFPSCAHLDLGRLGGGALLAEIILRSHPPCPFPQDHVPFPSHSKKRRWRSRQGAFLAPCRFAVSLSRNDSASLFFWLLKTKLNLVPKDGSFPDHEKNRRASSRTRFLAKEQRIL